MELQWSNIQVQLCKNRDKSRSKPFIGEGGKLENPRGLTYCKREQRLVTPVDPCNCHNEKNSSDYEISCRFCKKTLARYSVVNGEDGIKDGIVGFRYTQYLLAYRPRAGGLIGLECSCGMSDTRLSTVEKLKNPDKYPERVPNNDDKDADFGSKGKYFKVKKL